MDELSSDVVKPSFCLVADFDRDMVKENGWTLISDLEATEGEFVPELVEFLKKGEDCITGEEMVKRTELKNCGGQRAAEAMFRKQEKIPQGWQKYILIFPKTVWLAYYCHQRVAYLIWNGSRWCLDFHLLGIDFYGSSRVVRLGKQKTD